MMQKSGKRLRVACVVLIATGFYFLAGYHAASSRVWASTPMKELVSKKDSLAQKNQKVAESLEAGEISLQIDLGNSIPLRKEIYGVNGMMAWGTKHYGTAEFNKNFAETGMQFTRFPGGTVANYYDWKQEKYVIWDKMDARTRKRVVAFNRPLKKHPYTTDDFIQTIKAVKIPFAIVLNVACMSPASSREWMLYFKKRGVTVTYIEMANELYHGSYKWAFKDGYEYSAASRKHAAAVREIFPNVKIGVVVSSIAYTWETYMNEAEDFSQKGHYERPKSFDIAAGKADYADAFILHVYSSNGMPWKVKEKDYVPYRVMYRNALSHFDTKFVPVVERLKKLGTDKELWITEWDISAWGGGARKFGRGGANSCYATVLFNAHALLTFFQTPMITAANHHIVGKLWGKENYKPSIHHAMLTMYKQAVLTGKTVSPVTSQGAAVYTTKYRLAVGNDILGGTQRSEINAGFFSNESEGYLFIVNKLGTAYSLKSITFADQSSMKLVDKLTLKPDGNNPDMDIQKQTYDLQRTLLTKNHFPIVIPPYSVTRIHTSR